MRIKPVPPVTPSLKSYNRDTYNRRQLEAQAEALKKLKSKLKPTSENKINIKI